MPAYHQIGHDSQNLVDEGDLASFRGAVLSPVNYEQSKVAWQAREWLKRDGFDVVFDPQLYYPRSTRGFLRDWPYFPRDFDTADQSSFAWWRRINEEIAGTCAAIGPSSVCSPAVVPNAFSDEYFSLSVQVGNELVALMSGSPITVWQTAIVNFQDLATRDRALAVASILSRTNAQQLYVVFLSTVVPRRELKGVEELAGAMRLISALEETGIRVLVGFCSSDVILWKAAGATSCASGKYFNLRRFTSSRWDEEQAAGGGQVAYWFEESLLTFLRQSDLIRTARRNLLSASSLANPYGRQILDQLQQAPNEAWLKLSWRQFLFWFSSIERRISQNDDDPESMLVTAESNWQMQPSLLFEEVANNGDWVRSWRIALLEFSQL